MLTLFCLYNSICACDILVRSLPYFFFSSSNCGASSAILRELRCWGRVSGSVIMRIKIVEIIIAMTKLLPNRPYRNNSMLTSGTMRISTTFFLQTSAQPGRSSVRN